jgi:IS30 family transposase|tara:strand:+ start:2867 stop:3166 length:300 start_codon:yes stop_codon:yes gene_type:complete
MAKMEPYKDKGWLYEHYVKKRMKLTDICKVLKQTHNIEVTPQALYNWCKKYDLLKFKGKGRVLKGISQRRPKSPMQEKVERMRRERQKAIKARRKKIGR